MQGLDLIIRCPICHGKLEFSEGARCHGCQRRYSEAEGIPILVDFEDSIFKPEDYATSAGKVIPRLQKGSRLGRFLGRLTYGDNEVASHNIHVFLGRVRAISAEPIVLVVGGGTIGSGVSDLYRDENVRVVGVDVYVSPIVEVICDGHKLPFANESFDGVLIQAVLEHVLDPHRVVEEIHRVLKHGGIVYAETPFMQQVHEQAYDFTRFTLSGHRWLFRKFSEVESGQVLGPGIGLLWSICYFVRSITGSNKVATIVTAPFFWLRLIEKLAKRGLALDAASGLFFMGSKAGQSLKANEMPDYYHRNR
ncbi:methyltransferase domain-containing protein [Aminobacter anthyllidis]|uniref:Methyltransferase domain-containing protein n=1 Tax=Aminobacter anthyllidis TaxID=1035067 RepID=A0A9X1D8P1_9HYPH|nr:methyltransferase domain-containing protein [Aminobacter anthyllidis]MBT1159331.1 methyltransferase domain-containing protein [Aminobacter anthyllidis]